MFKGKKPTTEKSLGTKLTGAEATDLYSSLNDSIFQDSFDKFVGDRETRRKQLNLREDVRASFNRNSSLEYSTNDEVTIDQNPPQSYRYSICSTPHINGHRVPRDLNVYFPDTLNSKSKAYSSSDLFESYVESERNGSLVPTNSTHKQSHISISSVESKACSSSNLFESYVKSERNRSRIPTNTTHKQSNISISSVGSSEIESSILHGSEASANNNVEKTNSNVCGKLNSEINSSKQSSFSSNSSSKAKRKASSKKQVSSYKWEPQATTRKHQKLISKAQEQSSNYVNPVGRILRSTSRENKLSASNFSSSNGSYSTDTSSHSSSNKSSRSGLSETQSSCFSFACVSQVPKDKSSSLSSSSNSSSKAKRKASSKKQDSSYKWKPQVTTRKPQKLISKAQEQSSNYVNPVGRILRSSSRENKLSASNFSSSNGSYSTDTSSHSSSNKSSRSGLSETQSSCFSFACVSQVPKDKSSSLSSSSNSSSKAKRKASSKKQDSSYKWKPQVTTRKPQKLISKAQEQSSNYVNPVGRILRSSSRENKLSASNFSSSNGSYSTDTSSHSSSNKSSRSGLSETQSSCFSFACVSQVPKDKSSESETSKHKIVESDCNQNSVQEHSSIKYDETYQGVSMSGSISMQVPLAALSHNFNNVGLILRGSTKRSLRANASQSQNSSANVDPRESDHQILGQIHPYQKNADTSIAEVRLSVPIMSPKQSTNKFSIAKNADTSIAEVRLSMPIMSLKQSTNKFSNARNADTSIAEVRLSVPIMSPKQSTNKFSIAKNADTSTAEVKLSVPIMSPKKTKNKFRNAKQNIPSFRKWLEPVIRSRNADTFIGKVRFPMPVLKKSFKRGGPSASELQLLKQRIPFFSFPSNKKGGDSMPVSNAEQSKLEQSTNKFSDANVLAVNDLNSVVSQPLNSVNEILSQSKENIQSKRSSGKDKSVNCKDSESKPLTCKENTTCNESSGQLTKSGSKENIQPMTNDTLCSTGNNKSVNCSKSIESRLSNRHVICSNNVTLRKRNPSNVNNLPVITESSYVTSEDVAICTLTNDIKREEIQIPEINETTSNAQENTIQLKSGKWRRQCSIYRRQTLQPQPAFKLEQTDVESTNQLKISLPNESHRQTLRHSVSFNSSRDTFVDFNETSDRRAVRRRRTSVLNPIGVGRLIASEFSSITYNARDTVLRKCQQSEPLEFDDIYSGSALRKCRKIGEGVYGEVFMNKTDAGRAVVLKIIPIEGFIEVNGEPQKKFDEILSEIIIALELSSLRNDKEFMTSSFTEVVQVRCVQGRYPQHLIDLWELYRDNYQTENDHPEIFTDDQLYIVLELANGGQDLEAFHFTNALQSKSALQQTTLALAVAEKKFQFEHRDLHWGNILHAPTDEKLINFKLNGNLLQIPSEGVKVTIIDYTLSRMRYENTVLYNDLSNDNELFTANGDYQFDIYRLMKRNLDNDWRRFEPFNNVLWLHYITDKFINGARYKNGKSRKHRLAIEQLMSIRDELTDYKSAEDCTDAVV